MSQTTEMNQQLKHLTVLEEAHHLLRKTSNQQSQEGANLQGKSVEMITNAIAEMRTYGEGFIIADQSPNLLDASVIRNTNTKIILRLPDGTDRHEVGSAASLNEEQINEIPKLKTGVAVIYQNSWLQPVLCAVKKYEDTMPYTHRYEDKELLQQKRQNASLLLRILLAGRLMEEPKLEIFVGEVDKLKSWLLNYPLDRALKQDLLLELSLFETGQHIKYWEQAAFEKLSKVVWDLLDGKKFASYAKNSASFEEYNEKFTHSLSRYLDTKGDREFEQAVIQCLLYQHSIERPGFRDFYFNWVEDVRKKEQWL